VPGRNLPPGPQAALIAFAIRFRGIVVLLAFVLLGYGAYSLLSARYDVFPEFAPPRVSIQTEAPGLSPEQVEVLVTRPIEIELNGVPGIKLLLSNSIQGLSVVNVFFNASSDIYRDRQVVAERLTVAAQRLPQGVHPPTITPLTSSSAMVLVVGLTSKVQSLMKLRSVADGLVRLRLVAVPGVADVAVFGGDIGSIQIQVHPDRLVRYGLGINDVVAAANRSTGVRGAGLIDLPNQRVVLQTQGQAITPEAIAGTILLRNTSGAVAIRDVADVVEAPLPPVSGATIQGGPGVVLNVEEQYGANTLEVTKALEAALAELHPVLEADQIAMQTDLFRPANFIVAATDNIRESLLIGGVLVIVVLWLFLFDVRTAAICSIAIPLSLVATAVVLLHFGATLNTMTLGGLAIAIGEVVDDAVIGVENIVRRLRENRRLPNPRPEARVILDATFAVRTAVVYATFAVILVFFPIIMLGGVAGRLFAPLGLAYVLAVLASLGVALTVTPALAMVLLSRRRVQLQDPPLLRWSRAIYEPPLRRIARRPGIVIAAAAAVTILGCAPIPFFGGSFIPELKEGHFDVHMVAVPGTSIQESLRLGQKVTEALRRIPFVRSVAQRVGRAELSPDTLGTHQSEFEVDLQPRLSGSQTAQVQAEINRALRDFVGVVFAVNTFLTERMEETFSGFTAEVAIKMFGDDLDILDRKAREIARVLGGVPGAESVQVQSPLGMPELTIALRKPDLERWGFDPVTVLDVVRTAYQGDVVGQVYPGSKVSDVLVILDAKSRRSITDVGNLSLRSPEGTRVLLKQLADIYETSGRYQVQHQGGQRMQTVTADVAGNDVESFVGEAKARIAAQVKLPPGAYISFAGAAEAQAQSQHDLLVNGLIAGVGMVLLLSVVTRNWRNLLLVLVNLPFALIGGVVAVFVIGGVMTVGAMVGFVSLFGITLRNSMMMISHYEHLVEAGGMVWGLETAIKGAADRLPAILMTSLVTGLGLLPLAIGMNAPGREIEGPMAVVIFGGLLSSMALNLLVLPTLALRYGRFVPAVDEFAATLGAAE
jgi:CzcA family heavy metal efflux pump